MIKIVKGNLVNTVTKSAFDNFFKSQGWTQQVEGDITPPTPVIEEAVEAESEELDDSEGWDEVLDELKDDEVEKPLSEMSKKELLEKARKIGLRVNGTETNKQLREAIKASK